MPTAASMPIGVGEGPQGNDLWFTEFAGNKIGQLLVDCSSSSAGTGTCGQG